MNLACQNPVVVDLCRDMLGVGAKKRIPQHYDPVLLVLFYFLIHLLNLVDVICAFRLIRGIQGNGGHEEE